MASLMRSDDIVPFTMKSIGMIDCFHFFRGDFTAGGVFAAIQSAAHGQSFRGRCLGNELDDGFIVTQRLAPPIRRDEGKQTMLDLVPLAGSRRKMTHGQNQTGFIRQLLQLQVPQAQPPAIAPSTVGRNEDRIRSRIEPFPFIAPPAPDGCHRKRARVMIGPDIDKSTVAPDIVNAIRIGPRYLCVANS